MDSAFGWYVLIPSHRVGLQLLMHRLGCHPRIGQWSLEFRICLALRLDQPVNLRHKFWLLLFGLVSTTSRVSSRGSDLVIAGVRPVIAGVRPVIAGVSHRGG